MKIDALDLAERRLISQVDSVTGLMEEKGVQLIENGVYSEYRRIYENYVVLIESENEGLEALKRAIFLKWYELAEPSCFTGLYELPENAARKAFEVLEHRIETAGLDFELHWMLPFYNEIAEWVFLPYSDLQNLQSYLAKAETNLIDKANLKAEDFENRGQMGDYWQSIIATYSR
jgi:hypothetical protein